MCNWICEYFVMYYKAQDKKTNAKQKTLKINIAQMVLLQESEFTLSDQNCLEKLFH